MTQLTEGRNSYLAEFERFEKSLAGNGPPLAYRLRQAAVARFADLGFPTTRDEDWRFTNVAALARATFELANPGVAPATWQCDPLPKGVIVEPLAEALVKHPELVEPHLGRYADSKDHGFVALNTAFLRDGLFVYVPKNGVVESPIALNFQATGSDRPLTWQRRVLVVVAAAGQCRLVESYAGPNGNGYFTNAVTEVYVGEGAVVDHIKVQEEGDQAFHVSTTQVYLERGATFTSQAIQLGGALVRNDVNAIFGGERAEATLNGLSLARGKQHIDNHTLIDHARANCASHELYKSILDDKAVGVFNGKIFVRPDAQKTDAKQTNQTLLLSDDATINTKPQLEIFADDVKCTHGATVGQLDETALFYLRTRGIGLEAARALLIFAFANDIIGRISVAPLRSRLEARILADRGLRHEEGAGL
jgi:Fe-S cluster assembly protein SufD